MSFKLILSSCAVAMLCFAFLSPAAASNLQGTFIYLPDKIDNINMAIDRTVEGMNAFMRVIAREQLRKNNKPDKRITLEIAAGRVGITTDEDAPMHTSLDGTPVKLENEEGEVLVMSTRLEGEVLRQTIKAEGGQKVTVYSVSPDGQTLSLDVTVSSERLKIPLRYRLVYRRA